MMIWRNNIMTQMCYVKVCDVSGSNIWLGIMYTSWVKISVNCLQFWLYEAYVWGLLINMSLLYWSPSSWWSKHNNKFSKKNILIYKSCKQKVPLVSHSHTKNYILIFINDQSFPPSHYLFILGRYRYVFLVILCTPITRRRHCTFRSVIHTVKMINYA